MSFSSIVLIVVAVLVVTAIVIALVLYGEKQSRRRRHLRDRFGPEYQRVVAVAGNAGAAERELERREQRAAAFDIRPLSLEDRERFARQWQQVQAEFVDAPRDSLAHADKLLGEVMNSRGYPVRDFEQRAADLSVDHPVVVQHYHAARGIALRQKKGQANTEDLRQAMIHYRALFEDLTSEVTSSRSRHVLAPHAAE